MNVDDYLPRIGVLTAIQGPSPMWRFWDITDNTTYMLDEGVLAYSGKIIHNNERCVAAKPFQQTLVGYSRTNMFTERMFMPNSDIMSHFHSKASERRLYILGAP